MDAPRCGRHRSIQVDCIMQVISKLERNKGEWKEMGRVAKGEKDETGVREERETEERKRKISKSVVGC